MANGTRARRGKPARPSELEQLPLFATPADKRRGDGRKRGSGSKRRPGSKRPGRKAKGPRPGSSHKARPALKARHPVHVVLRVVSAVGNLRRRATYKAVREATLTTARREDFRIV
ncbi:MAG TPA: hypothetical protein VLM79_22955, partial [Kofleriaceae bacterium]|nr:hypothetical protein [Kofleriaceae bacterium]